MPIKGKKKRNKKINHSSTKCFPNKSQDFKRLHTKFWRIAKNIILLNIHVHIMKVFTDTKRKEKFDNVQFWKLKFRNEFEYW